MKGWVYLETLGCAKNIVDSQVMIGRLLNEGYELTADPEQCDVMIVNTCGFIADAVNESIHRILTLAQLKQAGAPKTLIVAGCLSER